ncbi:MAG: hypothetical protein UV50_C0011G0002 [Parcubacteria group bacterium GW2011_GWB1_42_9]|nr:MAG: hypothetical protein UV50_C0011G0002 [Parcubacteria group bacterium GW2011_GWB1_42_9]
MLNSATRARMIERLYCGQLVHWHAILYIQYWKGASTVRTIALFRFIYYFELFSDDLFCL